MGRISLSREKLGPSAAPNQGGGGAVGGTCPPGGM
jgi:hypothetical protein